MAVVVQTDTRLEFFHTLARRDTFGHSSVQCLQEAAQREKGQVYGDFRSLSKGNTIAPHELTRNDENPVLRLNTQKGAKRPY